MITKHLRSNTPGNVPSVSSMEEGQIAMNIQDGKIYTKSAVGNIVQMGASIKGDIFEGTVYGPSFQIASTKTMKENIKLFTEKATDLLNSVNVVSFNFIKDKDKEPKVGFIAEDTTAVLSGPKQAWMDVNNTLGVLIKGFQELSSKIDQLESKSLA